MIEQHGTFDRFLFIDLNTRSWQVHPVSRDLTAQYLGGKGVGLRLYYDLVGSERLPEVDPLSEENPLILSLGPLLATGAPCSGRFDAVTRSPLTNLMVTSSCGGPFGDCCRTAGWDGVIITGASETPVVVRIHDEGADFDDGSDLWGKGTVETQERVLTSPKEGALVIGRAGEQLVPFANVRSGNRYLGRGGIGAVLGAKRVKAVVALGRSYTMLPVDQQRFDRVKRRSIRYVQRNAFSKLYREQGTNANTAPSITAGYAPVRNFQKRTSPSIGRLAGDALQERHKFRHAGCRYCTILCGHTGEFSEGKRRHIPEYETMGMLGSNLEIYDSEIIAEWNDLINDLGMDTISVGATISWAMEAGERGLRPTQLKFGDAEGVRDIITAIADRTGEGADLSLGTRALSRKYGGADFACQVKGMEMAAYDPRGAWGQGLTFAVNNRGGCHLGSFLVGPEAIFGFLSPYTTRGKAAWAVFFEDLFSGINSLQTCQFLAFSVILEPPIARFTPRPLLKAAMGFLPSVTAWVMDWRVLSSLFSSITGIPLTMREFKLAGARIHVLERYMNTLLGVRAVDDTLPGRFLHESSTDHERESVVDLGPMVRKYYLLRGYDEDGVPTAETLERLGIRL